MEELTFSYNWNNKLECNSFTTLRLHNPTRYYKGREFSIVLMNKKEKQFKFIAEIDDVYPCRFENLSEHACKLDTGYSKADTLKIINNMYKNIPGFNIDTQVFDLVMLRKLNRDKTPKNNFKQMLNTCPSCFCPWDHIQIQSQTCNACGYPETNDNY